MIRELDVEIDQVRGSITAYFVDGDQPALVDPGPSTTLPNLERALSDLGAGFADVRFVLLTHVHLDHAGCAGHLAALIPEATVVVHEEGAPHLVDPTRLVASTRRTFGEAHDRLWGEVKPIPPHRLRPWRPGESDVVPALRTFPTPGHIAHHVSWLDERDGTLFGGDATGISLLPRGPVIAPTPPPGIDLEAWRKTLDRLESIGSERLAVAHAGIHDDPRIRLGAMRHTLDDLEQRVRIAVDHDRVEEDAVAWEAEVRDMLARSAGGDRAARHFDIFSLQTDYAGVVRYVQKGVPGRGASTAAERSR